MDQYHLFERFVLILVLEYWATCQMFFVEPSAFVKPRARTCMKWSVVLCSLLLYYSYIGTVNLADNSLFVLGPLSDLNERFSTFQACSRTVDETCAIFSFWFTLIQKLRLIKRWIMIFRNRRVDCQSKENTMKYGRWLTYEIFLFCVLAIYSKIPVNWHCEVRIAKAEVQLIKVGDRYKF